VRQSLLLPIQLENRHSPDQHGRGRVPGARLTAGG
jgi:hypothetical protein